MQTRRRCWRSCGGKATDRQLRLFAAACCRRVWPFLPGEPCREAVEVAERFADGHAGPKDLGRRRKPARTAVLHPAGFMPLAVAVALDEDLSCDAVARLAEEVTRFVAWECRGGRPVEYVAHPGQERSERGAQAALVRDLWGNPFRPAVLAPAWRPPEAVALARVVYDTRTFDRLPELANALERVGCTGPHVLAHLRAPGPHVRGCWALDLVLERQ